MVSIYKVERKPLICIIFSAYEKHQLPLDRFSTEHIRLAEKRKEYNEALDEATRRTELQQQRCEEMIANINAKGN
jgi:hypothetical protein